MSELERELAALAAGAWQLVALTDDLADDNAWIRCRVFGVDAFVQRFDGELRGFRNVCTHRGFPLRCERAGTGLVQCGFHGWRFGRDGVPNHIPRNAELFGLTLEQRRERALAPVRVEAIGRFVFAAVSDAAPSLADYLGRYADVFRTVSGQLGDVIYRETPRCAASWRSYVEITLDDYHVSVVHPTTFGAGEELPPFKAVYQRDGRHSAMLKRRDPDWSFDGWWRDVANGTLDRTGYKIFNLFPTSNLVIMASALVVSAVVPIAERECEVPMWAIAWRDASSTEGTAEYLATVHQEDRLACERWGEPVAGPLGALEQRIGWFREQLAQVMNAR